ncbi:hypothetical protein [Ottowia sp.]|uniref:ATP-dependent DNA ligase n=1 Tax=Ottowia sp. TaxID=1898956 RepID=UPI0025E03EA1|nr:hypothetical protein [Ottowia sp.]MBK6616365.1 hypothetical protein [Ottowia sp.]
MDKKVIERADLFCRAGSKNAVYHIQIVEQGDGTCVVNYQNGRAGGTLQTGSLTPAPVSLEAARKLFEKKVKSKLKDSPPYQLMDVAASVQFAEVSSDVSGRATGLVPQLLNEIGFDQWSEVERYINDPTFVAEHKVDGERRGALHIEGVGPVGSNRKSLQVALPQQIAASLAHAQCAVDGEILGDVLYVFDLYEVGGVCVRGLPLRERKKRLALIAGDFGPNVRVLPSAYTSDEKRALIERTRELGQEGVVFKSLDAPYEEGRPNSGGPQLKFKHWKFAHVVVVRCNEDRRSVVVGVVDGTDSSERVVEVGSVTVPQSKNVPPDGSIIRVKYLYAYEGGSLFEPTLAAVASAEQRCDARLEKLSFKKPHVEIAIGRVAIAA